MKRRKGVLTKFGQGGIVPQMEWRGVALDFKPFFALKLIQLLKVVLCKPLRLINSVLTDHCFGVIKSSLKWSNNIVKTGCYLKHFDKTKTFSALI